MKNFSNINENLDITTKGHVDQAVSSKLDKTTYEENKTINFGNTGVLKIGKFKVYDTNVTCEITSTTSLTYSGKLVIACQNYVITKMTVYGDAVNTIAPNIFVKPSTTSDPYIEVYFKPSSWSKNVIHIYGSAISEAPMDICANVSAVPSTATQKPINALTDTFALKTSVPDISGKANLNGGNSWTGTQTFTSPGSTNYSINASGYVKGSWLQSSTMQRYSSNTGKICVFDGAGWIYYRTPADVLLDAGGAKLADANNFTGVNTFTEQNGRTIINGSNVSIQAIGVMGSAEFSVKTDNDNKVFEVISDAENGAIHLNSMINIDNEQRGNVPLCIGGTNAGVSGQVLTSQGDNTTPIWSTPAISAANLVGSTLYLTINSTAAQTSNIANASVYNDIY